MAIVVPTSPIAPHQPTALVTPYRLLISTQLDAPEVITAARIHRPNRCRTLDFIASEKGYFAKYGEYDSRSKRFLAVTRDNVVLGSGRWN